LEGSILKNLLLGYDVSRGSNETNAAGGQTAGGGGNGGGGRGGGQVDDEGGGFGGRYAEGGCKGDGVDEAYFDCVWTLAARCDWGGEEWVVEC